MPRDEIRVAVNGTSYGGWKTAAVSRSIDSLCGQFDMGLMDRWSIGQELIEIRPGDACQALIGDEPVMTGYVDSVAPAISAGEHSVNISGRDKTCDLVDCSAEIESFEMIGLTLAEIAGLICGKFDGLGVDVRTDVGQPFARFAVQPGETAYSCLDRAAKQRGVLLTTDPDGRLALSARGVFERTGDALVQGRNILAASANFDMRDRFSEYTVNGQTPAFDDGADDPEADQIGIARDVNVMRRRPLILTAEAWTLPDAARTRAENECCSRAGRAVKANVQVAGWRQSSGALWQPGLKVMITAPALYFDSVELVVSSLRFTFSDGGGTVTELELTRPDAYLDSQAGEVEEDPLG
jgi:prophage tail gpP-like protein